jgi:hypothetical protein
MSEELRVGLKAYRGIPGRSYASTEVCENPVCANSFPQTGLAIEPRRHCSGECRQAASIIKRAAKLLAGLSDERAIQILRKSHGDHNGGN